MQARHETFEHEADVGVRGFGPDPATAFAQAALALVSIVVDPSRIEPRDCVELAAEAPDLELLLVDWLNAIVYAMATRRLLFARFDVRIDAGAGGPRLTAVAHGEPVDVARHQPAVEVKGATWTALAVRAADGGWLAQCVVDV
jgi:SHS2 domain-containing protein